MRGPVRLRRIAACLMLAAFALPLASVAPAWAACAPPPGRSSPEGRALIRTHPLIVYGALVGDVPKDAHGAYTVFVDVIRFYSGSDPQNRRRLTVTNYGNLDLHDGYEQPGNRTSLAASVDVLRRYAGQRVVLFLSPNDDALGKDTQRRYKDQYATTSCTYNVVGNKDVPELLRLLGLVFSQPVPTNLPSGVPTTPGVDPTAVPTGSLGARPAADVTDDDGRSGDIARAAYLAILVAAGLLLYRSTRSPLFERWRAHAANPPAAPPAKPDANT